MICKHCGTDNRNNAEFCSKCGELMQQAETLHEDKVVHGTPNAVMTTGCKIWLWLVFIFNILSAVSGIGMIGMGAALNGLSAIVCGILLLWGARQLLKFQKKGFQLIIIGCVIAMVVNILSGMGIVSSVISAALCPLITYFFMSRNQGIFV
ncbi:MAG: zinc-ribbon domain-containing protein [Butyricicoccaceae bacterium]